MKKGRREFRKEHEQDKENRELGGNHQQVMIRVSHDTGGTLQDEAGGLIRPGKRELQWHVEVLGEVLLQQRRKDGHMCVL